MTFFDAAQADQLRREEEQNQRVRQQIEQAGPLNGTARSADGAVTVEVSSGGMPRQLEITPAAMSRGAATLRADILSASKKATARANYRAQQAYGKAMGSPGVDAAQQLGLTYDPELLEDEHEQGGWRR